MNQQQALDHDANIKAFQDGELQQYYDGAWHDVAHLFVSLDSKQFRRKPKPLIRYIATWFNCGTIESSSFVGNPTQIVAIFSHKPGFKLHALDCSDE